MEFSSTKEKINKILSEEEVVEIINANCFDVSNDRVVCCIVSNKKVNIKTSIVLTVSDLLYGSSL
jgi:hypothetical protein